MGGLIPHVLWRTPLRRTRLSLAAAIAVASSAALVGVPAIADAAPPVKPDVPVQLIAMNDVLINDVVIIPEVNRAADTYAISNNLNNDNVAVGPFEINYWNIANWNTVEGDD